MSDTPERDKGDRVRQDFACIADQVEGKDPCSSSDALHLFYHKTEEKGEWYDGYCRSCNQFFNEKQLLESTLGDTFFSGEHKEAALKKYKPKARVTRREALTLQKNTVGGEDLLKGPARPYRGLKAEYLKFYGHRLEYDENGELDKIWYPETQANQVYGFKPRLTKEKSFALNHLGWTGPESDLSGSSRFKAGGKYLAIVGGENDKVALFQCLRDAQIRKGQEDYDPVAVVSPTSGEGSIATQIRNNYDFIDSFEVIKVGLDNDEAGEAATEELLKFLPKEKVELIKWSMKDPHEMLEAGKEVQVLSNFYNAKPVVPNEIKTSKDADAEMEEELLRDGVPLPPFMHKLSDMMAGDIPLGYIVNFIAQTGGGKTTFINEMIYYWIFNCPHRVGILSLELNAGQYQTAMLSRHIGVKIQRIKGKAAKQEFLNRPEVIEARQELREDEYGRERYALLDERDGDLEQVKGEINKLIRKHECKVIIIDPIQDLFEGAPIEEQSGFIKFLKATSKQGIAIINVCHITKVPTRMDSKGNRIRRKLTEDDVAGVSNIVKSGAANVFYDRDKYAETELEMNTTNVYMPKCRWTGDAGDAGNWYYDNSSHTVYELEDWLKMKGLDNEGEEEEDVPDQPEEELSEEESVFGD